MTDGTLILEVEEALGRAAEMLRLAGEIEAGIARAASGERESLWRCEFGSF
jgi:hypothetical protein